MNNMLNLNTENNFDITNGEALEFQLAFAGVSADYVNTIESAAAFLHNYTIKDAKSFDKLKRAKEILEYRLNAKIEIAQARGVPEGERADFCLIIEKKEVAPIFWESYKSHLKKPFDFLIGTTEENSAVVANLEDMPHLLIAGETGCGKSVLLHTIIQSLNYSKGEKAVNYVMIDTKRAEITKYDRALGYGLPTICTTYGKAFECLYALNSIMDKRYQELEKKGEQRGDFGRYIVIVDELADLMMQDRKQIEPYLIRLAQMGRAANIHLILATQRPTVDVCTGHIKANIPSRIALKTASPRDSINIIDRKGAEGLRGKGDALVRLSTDTELRRVQCFNNKTKIKKIY